MMRAVEMYMIIAVTLTTTSLGLPQACLHYCNISLESSSIPKECDCYLHNLRKTPSTSKDITPLPDDSGYFYDSVKPRFFQNTSFNKQTMHMNINSIFKSKQNAVNGSKKDLISINSGELIAEQDSYHENDSKLSNKYKRGDNNFPKLVVETKQLPLHLYFDLDVNTSEDDNRSQLEELKNMIKSFQDIEKSLTECIDLHIYIFSKYSNTINKTNMNGGSKDQHDNLSSLQQLTEIQSKCDQPANIIKQSIYQIKQILSREDKTTEITQDEQETIHTTDSFKDIIVAQNAINESQNINTSNIYLDILTTYSTDDVYNVATEPTDNAENVKFYETYPEHDDYNLLYNKNLPDMKNSDITSTSSFYEDSTVYNHLAAATELPDYGELRTTSQTDRIVFNEKDMAIPRIITKELSNGTLMSVVDGYEKVSNSDFETNNIISHINKSTNVNSNKNNQSNTYFMKSDIDKTGKSEIVNIQGNLYFSFGTNQIPARFIQQSDGKLDVAIDGFSMCDHMLEYNTSNFMNLLCKCIIHKKCT